MAHQNSVWKLHGRRKVGVYFSSSGVVALLALLSLSACLSPAESGLDPNLQSDWVDEAPDTLTSSLLATCGNGSVDNHEECDGSHDSACPGACSAECACPATHRGLLEMHVIDVGQGESILLISPEGFALLYDTGTESHAGAVIDYVASLGLEQLDYMVISHMHKDHMGAADKLLEVFPEIVGVYDHGASFPSHEFTEYVEAAGSRRTQVQVGDRLDMGASMAVEVLHSGVGSADENQNSVVLRVTYGDVAFLLGGDCDGACESGLRPGQIDVLNVHHHGSSTGTSSAFLGRIDATDGIISVGEGNRYGHPTRTVLDELHDHGVNVHRTDLDGDVVVVSDGHEYSFGGELRPASHDLLISEVDYDTPGTDSKEESVAVHNPGGAPVPLGGWTLVDGSGRSWSFPAALTIDGHETITVARDAAGYSALNGARADVAGLDLSLNNSGDELTLFDTMGRSVDYVAWEGFAPSWDLTAATGETLVRANPNRDTDRADDWIVTH